MTEITVGTVTVSARAPRAVLVLPSEVTEVDLAAATSQTSSLHRALEWLGRVWGGAFMPIVPVIGDRVPDVFVRLARAYDPDMVLPWRVTVAELELRDPIAAESVAHRLSSQAAQGRAITREARLASAQLVPPPNSDRRAAESLSAELNPFGSAAGACAHHLQTDLPRPLVPMSRVVPDMVVGSHWQARTPSSHAVVDLDFSSLDPWLATLLKMRLGVTGFPQGSADSLAVRPPGEQPTYYTFDAGRHREHAIRVGVSGGQLFGSRGTATTDWWADGTLDRTPLRKTRRGLSELSYGLPAARPFLLVAGDSTADAALYQSWVVVYGPDSAAWLPSWIAHAPETDAARLPLEHVREMVMVRGARRHPAGSVTSFSLDSDVLARLRDHLATEFWDRDVLAAISDWEIRLPDEVPVTERPEVFTVAPDTFGSDWAVTMADGVATSPVRAPVPTVLGTSPFLSEGVMANWVADAVVDGCKLPSRRDAAAAAVVADSLVGGASRDVEPNACEDVRCGTSGTSWIARKPVALPAGLNESLFLTPVTLRTPTMGTILDALTARQPAPPAFDVNDLDSACPPYESDRVGPRPVSRPTDLLDGTRWTLSNAGAFYDQFAAMCGGIKPLLHVLREHHYRSVLYAFDDDAENVGVRIADRKYLRLFDFRRAFGGMPAFVGGLPVVRSIVDEFLAAGILSRGLVLKCAQCRHTDFHPLEQLGQSFNCTRCARTSPLSAESWCGTPPNEPGWFYRRDEVVHQALCHRIEGPAFALAALGADEPTSRYMWASEIEVEPGHRVEVDFVSLVGGRLSVGEAKTNDELGKTLRTARVAATRTTAAAAHLQADEVVFATTQPAWSESTLRAIQTVREDPLRRWIKVVAVEGLA